MNRHPITAKTMKLRAMVEKAGQADKPSQPCPWCEAVNAGDLTSTAIARPKDERQCAEHYALNVRWSRYFATAPIGSPSIMDEIVAEGIAIAEGKRQQRAA
jgi:hypothetical protein